MAEAVTVVELFQSQGCSSCPRAIANLNALADRPDILPLMFAVTYWDRLGWKDTFARPDYTARQYDYAAGLHHSGIYTPQVVINGCEELVGANRDELNRALMRARPLQGAQVTVSGNTVTVTGTDRHDPADVWLVWYDPRRIDVRIGAGENTGATIGYRNIVREFRRLGTWEGRADEFEIPKAPDSNFRAAVLVQAPHGGPILAAKLL
jgi:hypothetical protein